MTGECTFSTEEQKTLHDAARSVIRGKCLGEQTPPVTADSEHLRRPGGAFVTLRRNGQLRGCIGLVESDIPIIETVQRMAVQAAFSDPRFSPLRADELDGLELEISVLGPPKKANDINEITIGRHGLIIRRGTRSGLLLPQVPVEQGWDLKTFLEWTCKKAGLPPTAWKEPDTDIFIFTAEVF